MKQMRDRLIELIDKACHQEAFDAVFSSIDDVLDMPKGKEYMANYLIEKGVIVPPMNIGQQCFILGYDFGKRKECVKECRVSCVTQKKNGSFAIRISETKYSATHNFTPDDIGKTVFLTKEEAEQALKGGVQE